MLNHFIMMLNSQAQVAPEPEPEPDPTYPLVLDEDMVTFTAAQNLGGILAGVHNLFTPQLIWHNGRTYYAYPGVYQNPPYGQIYVIPYDENDGVYKPYRAGNTQILHPTLGVPDSHTEPSIQVDNDGNIFLFQERTHDTPIDMYKGSSFTNIAMLSEKINPGTGATAESSYHNIIKLEDGNGWSWCRMTRIYEAYSGGHGASVSASDGFESWGSLVRNTTNPRAATSPSDARTDRTRHYPTMPLYRQVVGDYIYVLRTQRVDSGSIGIWHKYYIHRTPKGTGRGVVFENLIGTPHTQDTSGANYMDETDLDTHFMYHDSGDPANNSYTPVATVSLRPKVFIIVGDGNTGDLLLHIIDVPTRVLTTKSLNITGYTVYDPSSSQGHCVRHLAFIEDGQYLEIGLEMDYPSSVIKTHIFRSYDLGDTFQDQGDMTPDVSTTVWRLSFPFNYHDIPNGRNFIVTLHGPTPGDSQTNITYIKRAAKGAIQSETPVVVTPAVSLSDSANFFDYVATDGQISRSGNNVTGLTDQFGLRNATGVNNPQWNGSDEITLNGTTNYFTIPTTGFSALTRGTFFAVVRRTSTGNCRFFVLSNNGDPANYVSFNIATTASGAAVGWTHKIGTAGAELTEAGQNVMANGDLALIAFTFDGKAINIYFNGLKQHYSSVGYSTLAHYERRGSMNFGTITSVRLGSLDTSGTDFLYPFGFKRLTMKNTVYDFETYRALEKRIADLHGITLNYGYA